MASLEEEVRACTAAVKELTAAIKAGGVKSAAAAPAAAAATPAPAATPKAPSVTEADVRAKAAELKNSLGAPVAKDVIKAVGGGDLAALITQKKKWGDFITAANAKLSPDPEDEPAAEEDEEL